MSSQTALPLDREIVEALTRDLLSVVMEHYRRRPTTRATAQEVLNATAVVAAIIITAARECDDEAGARAFFGLALGQQLALEQPTTLGELHGRLQR